MSELSAARAVRQPLVVRYPSLLIFLGCLALFTLGVTVLAEGFGIGVISTSFVKTLGKTLCLCLVALAMDLVWGYCGILSLGHMAFFGIGGYAIGMWLMYARTEIIVAESLANQPCRRRRRRSRTGSRRKSSGWWARRNFPPIWAFSHSLTLQLLAVVLVPGLLALVFRLAGVPVSRDGGVSVDPDAGDDAGAVLVPVPERQRACAATTGYRACRTCPGLITCRNPRCRCGFSGRAALALGLGYLACTRVVSGKFGSVIRAIRDDEARVRFLGYPVEAL